MFSPGQLYFAAFFFLSFLVIIVLSYKKDRAKNTSYFKGSYKVLLVFLLLIVTLFVLKIATQQT